MAKLTVRARKALPKGDFAGPGKSYPDEDKAHAADAKGRAKQQLDKGKISRGEYQGIVAKADKKLGGKKSRKN